VQSFIEILPLRTVLSARQIDVIGQRTGGQRTGTGLTSDGRPDGIPENLMPPPRIIWRRNSHPIFSERAT